MGKTTTKTFLCDSVKSLSDAFVFACDFFEEKKYIKVVVTDKRSLDQNALQFFWYEQLEKQGDMHKDEYRNYCKLKFGIPILCQDPEFEYILNTLKKVDWESVAVSSGMTVLECKENFVGTISITSLMSTEQMKRYLDSIKKHFEREGFNLPSKI